MPGGTVHPGPSLPTASVTRRTVAIFLFAALLAGGLLYWSSGDPKVDALNEAIKRNGSKALRDYPYQFRVLRLETGVATMTTPRSPQVPVYRMIRAIDPTVNPRNPNDPDFVAAEKALAASSPRPVRSSSPSQA